MSMVPEEVRRKNTEQRFDTAIENYNYDEAADIAWVHTERLKEFARKGIYRREMTQLAMKGFSIPLYKRLQIELDGHTSADDMPSIEPVYSNITNLIRETQAFGRLIDRTNPNSTGMVGGLHGDMSELIVLALTTRYISGTANDSLTIVPSTVAEDKSSYQRKVGNGNFDFKVHKRHTRNVMKVQVKTEHSDIRYQSSIDVVKIIPKLVGNVLELRSLREALVMDGQNTAGQENIDRIESAAYQIYEVYDDRLQSQGDPGILSKNSTE